MILKKLLTYSKGKIFYKEVKIYDMYCTHPEHRGRLFRSCTGSPCEGCAFCTFYPCKRSSSILVRWPIEIKWKWIRVELYLQNSCNIKILVFSGVFLYTVIYILDWQNNVSVSFPLYLGLHFLSYCCFQI